MPEWAMTRQEEVVSTGEGPGAETKTETGLQRATTPGLGRAPRVGADTDKDRRGQPAASVAKLRPGEETAGTPPAEAAWLPPAYTELARVPPSSVRASGSLRPPVEAAQLPRK